MFRVLIVDDEEPVLDSFSYMITEYSSDFVLAGKARNSYEAISAIHELCPDVVFMDINIPGMDGLQVIDMVHKQYPTMIFVLSTAYERFDLAQRAIPLGVHAYLVKPITKKVFIETLDEIKNKLNKSKPSSIMNEKKFLLDYFFNKVIDRDLEDNDLEEIKEKLGITYGQGRICIVEIEGSNEKCINEIASRLSLKYLSFYIINKNRGIYFIAGKTDDDVITKILTETINQCVSKDTECNVGIGIETEIKKIRNSYESALVVLLKNKTNEQILFRERIKIIQIRKKIGFASKSDLIRLFEYYLDDIFSYYDFNVAKCKLSILFSFLIDDLSNYYKDTDSIEYFVPAELELMRTETKEESKTWGITYFGKLQDLFFEKRNKSMPIPLLKALNYVQDHYSEQIQLSTVADAVLISPAYLSRLFTEYFSTNFIDYVTDLRISEAQRLIKSTNMSIKEIADKVGYSDPNYFTKCFKKNTGYTPTEYLESISQKERSV